MHTNPPTLRYDRQWNIGIAETWLEMLVEHTEPERYSAKLVARCLEAYENRLRMAFA